MQESDATQRPRGGDAEDHESAGESGEIATLIARTSETASER